MFCGLYSICSYWIGFRAQCSSIHRPVSGCRFGDYSLMARIKVKMKRSLMLGRPKIDSPLLLTQFEVWWCLRRLCKRIISCCIWNMWQECMVEFLHSLWAMVVWFNLIRLADVAMVEVLHLTKCTQLMQQWIRIALLLFTTGELFRKKLNFVAFLKSQPLLQ